MGRPLAILSQCGVVDTLRWFTHRNLHIKKSSTSETGFKMLDKPKSKSSKYGGLGSPIVSRSNPIWYGNSKQPPGYEWSLSRDLDMNEEFGWRDRRKPLTKLIRPDRPDPCIGAMVAYGD